MPEWFLIQKTKTAGFTPAVFYCINLIVLKIITFQAHTLPDPIRYMTLRQFPGNRHLGSLYSSTAYIMFFCRLFYKVKTQIFYAAIFA